MQLLSYNTKYQNMHIDIFFIQIRLVLIFYDLFHVNMYIMQLSLSNVLIQLRFRSWVVHWCCVAFRCQVIFKVAFHTVKHFFITTCLSHLLLPFTSSHTHHLGRLQWPYCSHLVDISSSVIQCHPILAVEDWLSPMEKQSLYSICQCHINCY